MNNELFKPFAYCVYLATSLPPSLLTIGDHLLHTSLLFSSTLICLVHCVWPSYSSALSTLWCCQTIVSSVYLFSFFLQPCLLQSVEWVGCHCLSLCDQSKPVLESLSFPAIPFWHQAHWECWHLFTVYIMLVNAKQMIVVPPIIF